MVSLLYPSHRHLVITAYHHSHRVHQHQSTILQHFLHVLSAVPGCLAGVLLEKVLSSEETH